MYTLTESSGNARAAKRNEGFKMIMSHTIYDFVLHRSEVIKSINEILEGGWTKHEIDNGKAIPVEILWRPSLKYVLSQYRKAGWEVIRRIEISSESRQKKDYLTFTNPRWLKCPPEIRRVNVRP